MSDSNAALTAPQLVRPRTVVVGTLFASAAAAMLFLGLIGIYLVERADARAAGEEWFASGSIEMGPAGFVFATLILSVFTIQWALQAVKADDRTNSFVALGLTGLFGAAVFNQLWFIISDTGFTLSGGEASGAAGQQAQFLFFVINGVFAAFLIAAAGFLFLTFIRALVGQYSPLQSDGIAAAAMFWNTVVAMWAIIWLVVYVTK